MSETTATWSEARRSLSAAAEWRLLGLLFERPRDGWLQEIAALASEVQDAVMHRAAAEARAASEGVYLEVLGPGSRVSPREAAYRGREDPGHLLADVAAFYGAFAYEPQAEDPLDHVAVETGFVGYLQLKRAYAQARGDAEGASVCAEAAQHFVEAHLRWFAEPLLRALGPAAPPHLALAAQALLERTGPAPEAPFAPSAGEDGDLACDGCPGGEC